MRRNRWFSVMISVVLVVAALVAASIVANLLFDAPVSRTLATAIPIAFAVGAVELVSRRGGKRAGSETDGAR